MPKATEPTPGTLCNRPGQAFTAVAGGPALMHKRSQSAAKNTYSPNTRVRAACVHRFTSFPPEVELLDAAYWLEVVGALAGTDSNAELAALTRAFGAPAVKGFIVIFDFVIADALRLFGENRAAPPASPDLDPGDGRPCPLRSTVPASIPRRAPSTSKRCSTGWFPRRCGFGS